MWLPNDVDDDVRMEDYHENIGFCMVSEVIALYADMGALFALTMRRV